MLLLAHAVLVHGLFNYVGPKDSETQMDFLEMANHHGYHTMQYKVVTDDGYIITLFRILASKSRFSNMKAAAYDVGDKKPVLFVHGMMQDA